MKRVVDALDKPSRARRACTVLALYAMTAIGLSAQTLTTVFTFDGADGDGSRPLVQGMDGNLYSVAGGGGTNPYKGLAGGTVFKMTPSGTLTTLYNFCSLPNCADGDNPDGGLVQATNGDFYGTTQYGGAGPNVLLDGTVFKITPSGELTTLYSFCTHSGCADGASPETGLVQGSDGNFYGTTSAGGSLNCQGGCGTVFKITPSGALTTLYTFCAQSGCPDGSDPLGTLVQGTDGDF